MTHSEAKEKFKLVEVPLTNMEVVERTSTESNFITVHVALSFSEIVELGEADDYNDPILDRCFDGVVADISYNIVGIIERDDHDGGNDAIVAVTCDVSDILDEMEEPDEED